MKTTKTAGTSVEIALSKFCGPDDVITPLSRNDGKMRTRLGYPGPQNHYLPISSYGVKDFVNWLIKRDKKHFFNHISAKEVKAYIGDRVWRSYYKFCIERNPWDRCISLYFFRNRSEPRPLISKYIRSKAPLVLKKRGYDIYTINGTVAVDKVCRYENLTMELDEVRKHVGIPEKLQLPRAKSQFRKDKRSYQEILGRADKARIAELFHDEINLFGYQW